MNQTILTALFISAICEWIAGNNRTAARQMAMVLATREARVWS